MNIFVICPVRLGISEEATRYMEELEKQGHKVIYPPRDTEQSDFTGYNICSSNRAAIEWADEVHIFYHALSQGIHFDLGVTFALKKKIVLVKILQAANSNYGEKEKVNLKNKSFVRMLRDWEGRYDESS